MLEKDLNWSRSTIILNMHILIQGSGEYLTLSINCSCSAARIWPFYFSSSCRSLFADRKRYILTSVTLTVQLAKLPGS